MTHSLLDLDEVILLKVLSFIVNIREKIRLARVNSTFYNLVHEACRTQDYRLVNYSDYLYACEYQKPETHPNWRRFINLHDLLRVAPRLTHLVHKQNHFTYEPANSPTLPVPLPLLHCKYIYLDLTSAYLSRKGCDIYFDQRINATLANIPIAHTLEIRTDRFHQINFPLLPNLKLFKFGYYRKAEFHYFTDHTLHEEDVFPMILDNLFNGKTPNLEELVIGTQKPYFDSAERFLGFLSNLPFHCPHLRTFKMWLQSQRLIYDTAILLPKTFEYEKTFVLRKTPLLKLEYLDLRGITFGPATWEKILTLTPNLKFLVLNPTTDSRIAPLIQRLCPDAHYNLEKPFELEEEYRIYNQMTYCRNTDRFCC